MGTVFKAQQPDLERFVAIKILDPQFISDENSRKRFEREGKLLSTLVHKNIAGFVAFGFLSEKFPGAPFIVMDWLDGISLARALNESGSFETRRIIAIALQICDALAYAHKAGIIHRDLKPENIFLLQSEGENSIDVVKVIDFGLAGDESLVDEEQKLTKTGALIGTPKYLSPEQCVGSNKIDARSDMYALGCVMYEMVCGEAPFLADNVMGIMYKHINEIPEIPSHRTQKIIPEGLEELIMKCLEKDPARRYQSMSELKLDLDLDILAKHPNAKITSGAGSSDLENNSSSGAKQKTRLSRSGVIPAAVVIALFLGAILLYQFLSTQSSLPLQRAKESLAHHPNLDKLVEIEGFAAELRKKKNNSEAYLLESGVTSALARQLNERTKGKTTARDRIDDCLNFSELLLKSGNLDSSARYALRALEQAKVALFQHEVPELDAALEINRAAEFLIQGKRKLSSQESNSIALLASSCGRELESLGLDAPFEIVSLSVPRLSSPEVVNALQFRDRILAYRGDLAQLNLATKQTLKAMADSSDAEKAICLTHLADSLAHSGENKAAVSYLQKVEPLLLNIPDGNIDPLLLQRLSQTYLQIGNMQEAENYAKRSIRESIRTNRHFNKEKLAICQNQMVRVLLGQGKHNQATSLAGKTFTSIEENFNYFVMNARIDCVVLLFRLSPDDQTMKIVAQEKQVQTTKEAGNVRLLMLRLFDYYVQSGQYNKALETAQVGGMGRGRIDWYSEWSIAALKCASEMRDLESVEKIIKDLIKEKKAGGQPLRLFAPRRFRSLIMRRMGASAVLDTTRPFELNENWQTVTRSLKLLRENGRKDSYAQLLNLVVEDFNAELLSRHRDNAFLLKALDCLRDLGENEKRDSLEASMQSSNLTNTN